MSSFPTNKDNDISLLKKIAQNTAEFTGGVGGGAVASVNGQTGVVVLDNTDVGSPSTAEFSAAESQIDQLEADVAQLIGGTGTTNPSGNFLKSGGTFAHDGGLDIAVGESEYYIQGVLHASPAAIVTAAAADATHPRIDVIVLNSSDVAAIVTGTPAASPVKPEVDPSTQLELTFITVAALATEPQITVEPIYLENTEWTITPSAGTIDPDDTTGERSGTKAIKITAGAAGDNFKAVDAAPLDIAGYAQLTMWIHPVTWVSQKQLQVRCYLSNAPVGNIVTIRDGVFGFIRTTASYQLVAIPTSYFGLGATEPDEIRFTIAGGSTALTCFIDDIALQGGLSASTSNAMVNPMTTAGDLIVGGTDGAPQRLAMGAASEVLRVNAGGTGLEFAAPTGSGDMLLGTAQTVTAAKTYNAGTLKIASGGDIIDANNNELIKFTATASAVNEVTIANGTDAAAATTGVVLSATGGSTNVAITLTPKGSGSLRLNGANPLFAFVLSGTIKSSIKSEISAGSDIVGSEVDDLCFRSYASKGFRFSNNNGVSSQLSITSAGKIELAANGTNQNVTLSPSGTGRFRVIAPATQHGAVDFDTTSGASYSVLNFYASNVAQGAIGSVTAGNAQITGSADGDMVVRNYRSGNFLVSTDNGSTISFQVVASNGGIKTSAPTSGSAVAWKLGEIANVNPTSQNRTIRVEVNGTVLFISAKTTND